MLCAEQIASEQRFSLRSKGTNLIPAAEFPAIPESAAKIASERRCAILVHSSTAQNQKTPGQPAQAESTQAVFFPNLEVNLLKFLNVVGCSKAQKNTNEHKNQGELKGTN